MIREVGSGEARRGGGGIADIDGEAQSAGEALVGATDLDHAGGAEGEEREQVLQRLLADEVDEVHGGGLAVTAPPRADSRRE
jgi:hypothetical protein